MNTHVSDQDSPLSRFLEDDALTIMEHLIPLCPPPLAKALAIRMKLLELQKILSGFDDEPRLRACGFDDAPADPETLLRSLRGSVSEEAAGQIDSMLQILQFTRMYQQWQEITRSHPELLQLLQQGFTRNEDENGTGAGNNPFADPSLFMMLNAAMNRNGSDNPADTGGMHADNLNRILSAFMKKPT